MPIDHGALTAAERKALRSTGQLPKREPVEPIIPGTREAPPPRIPSDPPIVRERVIEKIERPEVPADFEHDQRTMLRVRALEFALEAARYLNAKFSSGEELLGQAEHIERWIAMSKGPKP